jgi:hypothetical protein
VLSDAELPTRVKPRQPFAGLQLDRPQMLHDLFGRVPLLGHDIDLPSEAQSTIHTGPNLPGQVTMIPGLLASLLLVCSTPSGATELELMAIVPDQVGSTVQKSPVLYYFISQATSLPTRFTLVDPRTTTPVAEVLLKTPTHPGIWAIRLGDYKIVLEEDVQYRWFVSVIRNRDSSQTDIVAGGMIERIEPRLVKYYGRPCDRDTVRYLVEAGIWYDAFACVNELIEANPQDKTLRDLRDGVLEIRSGGFHYRMPTEPRYYRHGQD